MEVMDVRAAKGGILGVSGIVISTLISIHEGGSSDSFGFSSTLSESCIGGYVTARVCEMSFSRLYRTW